jgi:hypothetical protein
MSNNSKSGRSDDVTQDVFKLGSDAAQSVRSSQRGKRTIPIQHRRVTTGRTAGKVRTKRELMTQTNQKRRLTEKARNARKSVIGTAKTAKRAGGGGIVKKAFTAVKFLLKKAIILVLVVLAFLVLLSVIMATVGTVLIGGSGPLTELLLKSFYLSEEADITSVGLYYTEMETDLALLIINISDAYPGYDDYIVTSDGIGHSPYTLMSYLTAVYEDFHFGNKIQYELEWLFAEQYNIDVYEEIREIEDPDDEDSIIEQRVLHVNLTNRTLERIVLRFMDADQTEHYEALLLTGGGRQYIPSPLDIEWASRVSSKYGWRVHPITHEKAYHRGVDIGIPTGTALYAVFDATVVTADYNADGYGWYIVLESGNGTRVLYAHCDELLAAKGDRVSKGAIVAMSGNTGRSTGPHLHFEIINRDGLPIDPLFFADMIP